jgi:hypothetical protein
MVKWLKSGAAAITDHVRDESADWRDTDSKPHLDMTQLAIRLLPTAGVLHCGDTATE